MPLPGNGASGVHLGLVGGQLAMSLDSSWDAKGPSVPPFTMPVHKKDGPMGGAVSRRGRVLLIGFWIPLGRTSGGEADPKPSLKISICSVPRISI